MTTGNPAAQGPGERLHALDALRAGMMMLGVIMHVALYYMVLDADWPKDEHNTTYVADVIVGFSHTFRMPVFFVIAGFFACMLYQRYGVGGFLAHRFRRILVPFVVALLLLYPLHTVCWKLALREPLHMDAVELLVPTDDLHLWFLYFLMLYCLVTAAGAVLAARLPATFLDRSRQIPGQLLQKPVLRLLVLAFPVFVLLLRMDGEIDTSVAFIPDKSVLLFYYLFFLSGWFLYFQRHQLGILMNRAALQVGLAVALFFGALVPALLLLGEQHHQLMVLLSSLLTALISWLMCFGLSGLFLKHFNRPSAVRRYVVDASYWVYLLHKPFALLFPALLNALALPALVKLPLAVALTMLVCFLSYEWLVRATWVGQALNGRRYPRGLPAQA